MKEIIIKIAKGLLLGGVFGAIVYLITKDIGTAALIALVMLLSMFAKSREQKIQSAIKHTKEYKDAQTKQQNSAKNTAAKKRFKDR